MKIEREDFDTWLANPVTEQVMKTFGMVADDAKRVWQQMSWDGQIDPLEQRYLRGRADIAMTISELTFEEMEKFSEGEE